jgi:hypothetical protein
MEVASDIIAAWEQAALSLGLSFVTPYHYFTPEARRLTYLGLVRGFGGDTGTLLRVINLGETGLPVKLEADFLVAPVGEKFALYDEFTFKKALRDWGYTGPPDQRPAWY